MADSATNYKLLTLERQVAALTARLESVEKDNGAKATTGSLQALSNRLNIDIAEMGDVVNRVEAKVGHITDPKETLALIGVEELRTIKTHLRQLIVIKQEIEEMRIQLVDMMAAYDLGQASTIL